eukprot:PhF_6_TR37127/c0_g1_i1/m.54594
MSVESYIVYYAPSQAHWKLGVQVSHPNTPPEFWDVTANQKVLEKIDHVMPCAFENPVELLNTLKTLDPSTKSPVALSETSGNLNVGSIALYVSSCPGRISLGSSSHQSNDGGGVYITSSTTKDPPIQCPAWKKILDVIGGCDYLMCGGQCIVIAKERRAAFFRSLAMSSSLTSFLSSVSDALSQCFTEKQSRSYVRILHGIILLSSWTPDKDIVGVAKLWEITNHSLLYDLLVQNLGSYEVVRNHFVINAFDVFFESLSLLLFEGIKGSNISSVTVVPRLTSDIPLSGTDEACIILTQSSVAAAVVTLSVGSFYENALREHIEPTLTLPDIYSNDHPTKVQQFCSIISDAVTLKGMDDEKLQSNLKSGGFSGNCFRCEGWLSHHRCQPLVTKSDVGRIMIHTTDAVISKMFVREFTVREMKRVSYIHSFGSSVQKVIDGASSLEIEITPERQNPSDPIMKAIEFSCKVLHTDLCQTLPVSTFAAEFRCLVPSTPGGLSTSAQELSKRVLSVCKLPSKYAQVGTHHVFMHSSTLKALRAAYDRILELHTNKLRSIGRGYMTRIAIGTTRHLLISTKKRHVDGKLMEELDCHRTHLSIQDSEYRKGIMRNLLYDGQKNKQIDHDLGKKLKDVVHVIESVVTMTASFFHSQTAGDQIEEFSETKPIRKITGTKPAASNKGACSTGDTEKIGRPKLTTASNKHPFEATSLLMSSTLTHRQKMEEKLAKEKEKRNVALQKAIAADIARQEAKQNRNYQEQRWAAQRQSWVDWERSVAPT